jgi:two-component system, NarL family, sensor histidine kinase DevS
MIAAVLLVQQHPRLGAMFERSPEGQVVVRSDDGLVLGTVAPVDEVTFAGTKGLVLERAARLTNDFVPHGSAADNADAYDRRSQLARLAAGGNVELSLPGARRHSISLTPRPREPWELGFDFWALLFSGAGGFMVGAWVWALRPRDWGARMFALSGIGLMVSALSAAVFQTGGPAVDGTLLWSMFALNLAGSQFCGAALIAQGLCYPRMVVRPGYLLVIPLAVIPLVVAVLAGWVALQMIDVAMLVEFAVLILLLGMQWRLARVDPLGRAALRWIALSTALGTSGFVIVNVAPTLLGQPVAGGDGVAFLLLLVIYAGTALGVGRYRLFDLDRWAYRVVVAIGGSLALLVVDALLVLGLRFQPQQALGVSLAFIGLIYLPARATVLNRLTGRPAMSPGEVLEAAEMVRFTPEPELRHRQWRSLMQKLFDPLEMAAAEEAVTVPMLRLDGLELVVPAAAGAGCLVLRYPSKGRALFSHAHISLVSQLVTLMERAESVREGYARGVAEERSRIARDLHDDVSGRLLTSLYRPSTSLIREDVRTAMADLRTIMRGLAGEQQPAQRLLATLRHETSTRLEAAGITLSWPIELEPASDPLLDYTRYKNLTSAHREVITNILRHAEASHVDVSSTCNDHRIALAIEDNGRGRPPVQANGQRAGAGMSNIRRRLEEIGGSVTVVDRPKGVRVELEVPLVKPAVPVLG